MRCMRSAAPPLRAGSPWVRGHRQVYGLRYKWLVEVLRLWNAWEQLIDDFFPLGTHEVAARPRSYITCPLTIVNLLK